MLIELEGLVKKYNLNIKGIIHGGAHHGEESAVYSKLGIDKVIWLEANPEKVEVCRQNLKDQSSNLIIQEALGDVDGEEVEFNVTNNGESSSILKLKDHKNFYPQIDVVSRFLVKTKRLDTILDEKNIDIAEYNFLNLDLQGVELRVIKGLGHYLDQIDYIYTEINRSELYEGCDQIEALDSYLENKGFRRVETAWTHAEWGDAFYIRLPKLKLIVTSYNNEDWVQTNIESILEQDYSNYEVLFVDDNSGDNTHHIALEIINGDPRFKTIKHDTNRSKAYSFITYVSEFVDDSDVVVFIDGDDWLPYKDTLTNVATHYAKTSCWVAYSRMLVYPSLNESPVHGRQHPSDVHRFNLYRRYPFIASHLKTTKGFLFKNIEQKDFIYDDEWIRFGDDVAIMCAVMEQSPTEKISVMDFIGYVYNESQSSRTTNDQKKGIDGENFIRQRKPYSVIRDNGDKYVSPRILGRLGNQMFEIATAYSFALDNGCSLKVTTQDGIFTSQLGETGSPLDYKHTVFRNIDFVDGISNYDTWNEPNFAYNPISYKFDSNLRLQGQFQSEKYFLHNKEQVLSLFSCDDATYEYIHRKYGNYLVKNTVSIHIRRGDYAITPNHHPLCGMEYYNKAIAQFPEADHILVFSDDPDWAKSNFIGEKFVVIEGEKDYVDLYIMSMCTNNIIANSSFSWWGAWLNANESKRVIAPSMWFGSALAQHDTTDLIPDNWTIL